MELTHEVTFGGFSLRISTMTTSFELSTSLKSPFVTTKLSTTSLRSQVMALSSTLASSMQNGQMDVWSRLLADTTKVEIPSGRNNG